MSSPLRVLTALTLGICISFTATAQPPSPPAATAQHKWLNKFVGKWSTQSEGIVSPEQPKIKAEGTVTSESVGPLWVINRFEMRVMGQSVAGIQTLGYDSAKEKFIGTWVDSATEHIWIYEGSLNDEQTKLTLEADGPSMTDASKMAKYRDAYEFVSDDEVKATSSVQLEDGSWLAFMKGSMTRAKDTP